MCKLAGHAIIAFFRDFWAIFYPFRAEGHFLFFGQCFCFPFLDFGPFSIQNQAAFANLELIEIKKREGTIGGVPTTRHPNTSAEVSRHKWGRIVIQIGGVYTTFCQAEGILSQKYRDKNGRCIAILFKNIGVRGRFDSSETNMHFSNVHFVLCQTDFWP